ncbi:MAG: radical SAM protein, partial [Planctomycetaceae bacterium]|nr:radical SAM protein [Planctomycetaceae bacterium]
EVNDDFIKAASDCEHLCPQFHPALQSGSNTVLTRMRRRYRVERFLDRLEQIRDLLGNDPAFSTDIIVGFPGETDAEFEETLETCRRARFMKVHVFPFSRRDGTPAATMPDQVAPEVIKERVHVLSDLERELAEQFYKSRINSSAVEPVVTGHAGRVPPIAEPDSPVLEVLAERQSETRPGYVRGSDRWYMPVEVPGTMQDHGQFILCRAVSADREGVVATRMTDAVVPNATEPQQRRTLTAMGETRKASGIEDSRAAVLSDSETPLDLVQLRMPHRDTRMTGADVWPH